METVSQQSYFQYFYNRTHFGTLFYSRYSPKIIKHMITDSDIFAYETMFWQYSNEGFKSCLKEFC